MSVVIINPNSTASMTISALAAAERAAPGVNFAGWTSRLAPASIQGPEDGAAALPPLLELVKQADAQGASGIIIACFDDTGLSEAREIARCPVIGIGQAAYHMASLIGDRFSVVTTVAEAVPVITENIRAGGFDEQLLEVLAADLPVLDLDPPRPHAYERLAYGIEQALESDPEVIILGCSGMVSVIDALRPDCPVPLIDGVSAAALLMACIIQLRHAPEELMPLPK